MASESQCERALALHEAMLTAIRGVTGLGITDADSGGCCIAVYVDAADTLGADIPLVLPLSLNKKTSITVPVKTIVLGKPELL